MYSCFYIVGKNINKISGNVPTALAGAWNEP